MRENRLHSQGLVTNTPAENAERCSLIGRDAVKDQQSPGGADSLPDLRAPLRPESVGLSSRETWIAEHPGSYVSTNYTSWTLLASVMFLPKKKSFISPVA